MYLYCEFVKFAATKYHQPKLCLLMSPQDFQGNVCFTKTSHRYHAAEYLQNQTNKAVLIISITGKINQKQCESGRISRPNTECFQYI